VTWHRSTSCFGVCRRRMLSVTVPLSHAHSRLYAHYLRFWHATFASHLSTRLTDGRAAWQGACTALTGEGREACSHYLPASNLERWMPLYTTNCTASKHDYACAPGTQHGGHCSSPHSTPYARTPALTDISCLTSAPRSRSFRRRQHNSANRAHAVPRTATIQSAQSRPGAGGAVQARRTCLDTTIVVKLLAKNGGMPHAMTQRRVFQTTT